jgi:hypothetical protein
MTLVHIICGAMRVLGYLVLLVTFTPTLSFAVPVEDLPETPYDQSECLAHEMTQPLPGDLLGESISALQVVPIVPTQLRSTPRHASHQAQRRGSAPHQVSHSVIPINHSLRC